MILLSPEAAAVVAGAVAALDARGSAGWEEGPGVGVLFEVEGSADVSRVDSAGVSTSC